MMKSIILIISIGLFATKALEQSPPIKTIPFYYDQTLVNNIIDSISRVNKIDSLFIFITNPSSTKENEKNIDQGTLTFIIWITNAKINIVRISDSDISDPIQTSVPLLIKGNCKEIAIRESENKLRMKPPLSAYYCDILIFRVGKSSYLFQCGSECSGFKLDSNKSNARCTLIDSVKKYISNGDWIWKTRQPYKRFE